MRQRILFFKRILLLLALAVYHTGHAFALTSLSAGISSAGDPSPALETTTPVAAKTPFSVNFTFGFPASISENTNSTPSSIQLPVKTDSSAISGSGKARIYEYGTNPELGPNPAWHHTTAALRQAMSMGVDMVYIHLGTFADFNVAATDIREKLTELNKPMTVFLDNGTNSAGAIISIQPDSSHPSSRMNQVKTAVYKLNGNQFKEKYKTYVDNILTKASKSTPENVPPNNHSFLASPLVASGKTTSETKSEKYSTVSNLNNNVVVIKYKPSFYETLLDFLLSPFVIFVLLFILFLGMILELRKPGTGFPLFASVGAAVLLFVPLHADGLADFSEMILFICGAFFLLLHYFGFRHRKVFFYSGVWMAFTGLTACLIPPLSSLSFDFRLFTTLFKPVFLISAASASVYLCCLFFPGLRPVLNRTSGHTKFSALKSLLPA